jgi:hypothetical protein
MGGAIPIEASAAALGCFVSSQPTVTCIRRCKQIDGSCVRDPSAGKTRAFGMTPIIKSGYMASSSASSKR